MESINLLQWNCQGIRNKKDEILEMIERQQINVLAIQETKLWNNCDFTISGYNSFRKDGHYNRSPHGGVAIFLHQDIPHEEITLVTEHQAVAVRANLGQNITICSIYISRNHKVSQQSLQQLCQQLTPPFIVMGDFNGYNTLWGSETTDCRGRLLEDFIMHNNVNILNDGTPTRITHISETAIDLTLCSPVLTPVLQWTVAESPGDSDHCPIVISLAGAQQTPSNPSARWNVGRADWDTYQSSDAWRHLPDTDTINTIESGLLLADLYKRINDASSQSIPQYKPSKYYPKPWWSKELKNSKIERERLYQKYRRNRTMENLLRWKKWRAEHKQKIRLSKKESWEKFVNTLNKNTPISKLYQNVRKIRGKANPKINLLKDNGIYYSTQAEISNKLAETFSNISSNNNYPDNFTILKDSEEQNVITLIQILITSIINHLQ